jgi:hypothetical protein
VTEQKKVRPEPEKRPKLGLKYGGPQSDRPLPQVGGAK